MQQAPITFEEEMFSWNNYLFYFAHKWFWNNEDAEDLVQQTYLEALRQKDKYTPGTNMKAWLWQIMRWQYKHWMYHWDTKWKYNWDTFPEWKQNRYELDYIGNPEPKVINRVYLEWMLNQLPFEWKQAIVLCFFEDMTYAQAGAFVGVTEGAIDHRINRARRALHQIRRTTYVNS